MDVIICPSPVNQGWCHDAPQGFVNEVSCINDDVDSAGDRVSIATKTVFFKLQIN